MKQPATFSDWVDQRTLHTIGTNHGSRPVPFQSWQKFKEAFAPELISRAVHESELEVRSLVDPFGGSGTTALAAQFLGIHPITFEVNPYLADVIEAKLTHYDLDDLRNDISTVVTSLAEPPALSKQSLSDAHSHLPPTFVEPGINHRWLFSSAVAQLILSTLDSISRVKNADHRRLMRVALGGTLVGLSNTRVSGKGRRYRTNWEARQKSRETAASTIQEALHSALDDVAKYNDRNCQSFQVLNGDSRKLMSSIGEVDLSIFSPPYPNSFDYTDVYNIELWMLGYLTSYAENQDLRRSTLSSHVQIDRDFAPAPEQSQILARTLALLETRRASLWDKRIPEMIGAYFSDIFGVISELSTSLKTGGEAWIVVGDSRYASVDVPVASILMELSEHAGYSILGREPFRSMRSSPQQGGRLELAETLLILRRD